MNSPLLRNESENEVLVSPNVNVSSVSMSVTLKVRNFRLLIFVLKCTSLVLLEDLVGRVFSAMEIIFTVFLYTVMKIDSGFMCLQQVRTNVK